ncbi:family 20 glycosylhydrolase [Parapedobacter sp.]
MKRIIWIWLLLGATTSGIGKPTESEKPRLIPLPQQLTWRSGGFDLAACGAIAILDRALRPEAEHLHHALKLQGTRIAAQPGDGPSIVLEVAEVTAPLQPDEAYSLVVSPLRIHVKANTRKGIFYAIQTLRQLKQGGNIPACEITDWPAFAWRGYLVDVGRNFQSMELLKEQIDVMAAYKLNVFHFHFTEDIAWRLQSKRYPALTAPENMLRNPGAYYTEADLHELISYCKERHIMLLPEIDMPGHSAAFRRALGVDMQHEEGMVAIKSILEEFCDTYEFTYIHIGGDEVEITNDRFLPEMVAYLESRGKRTVGWDPGGNLPKSTIRQCWMGGEKSIPDTASSLYIDSKHLYLNHMDPLETVPTIFYRQIGGQQAGHRSLLGGIVCSWPDRAVADERHTLWQNAIYPGLVTFGERSWRGGGHRGWRANVGRTTEPERIAEFAAYEERLMDHKERYFANKPFPYVRQSTLEWKFYGPFPNGGDLAKSFVPETEGFASQKHEPAFGAVGATLILRHWWSDIIHGLIDSARENTTWYAVTRIWSEAGGETPFWIGFDNFSRSYASDSPLAGTWDNRGSQIRVNGSLIPAPSWRQAGMKGNLEKPMVDEGYSFREPTLILLEKGWNTVVVKLPVASFRGSDWQNPVKWMFTFTPLPGH